MFTVVIGAGRERLAIKLKNKWGMSASGTYEKVTVCPHCGCDVSWYLHSRDDCVECKNDIPPFSDFMETIGARLEYYKGVEKINRYLWRD